MGQGAGLCAHPIYLYFPNPISTTPTAQPPQSHKHTNEPKQISLQVDELGFREGIPLRGQKRHDYLQFTAEAFRCAFAFLACVLVVWGRKKGFVFLLPPLSYKNTYILLKNSGWPPPSRGRTSSCTRTSRSPRHVMTDWANIPFRMRTRHILIDVNA